MKVVDHQPADWFFLESNEDYFLDVNCSRSFFGFSVAIRLTPEEVESYSRDGRNYIQELANQVSAKSDPCHPRSISEESILKVIHEAIMASKN